MQTLLRGAKYFDGQCFKQADIFVADGRIVSVDAPFDDHSHILEGEVTVLNFNNKYIFPGLVDVHVHFREPGFSYKEDMATGSAAAAAGGYTDVCTMPNLKPVPDSAEHLGEELEAIRQKAVIHVHPYAAISVGELGEELSDIEAMASDCIAFSDDGRGVADDEMMKQAMNRVKAQKKMIAAHCEDMTVIKGAHVHDGKIADALKIQGITSESETKMIERDIALVKETGCPYHVCHVSAKESVEAIRRAKAEGVNITCETGPHYLLLDENDILERLEAELKEEKDLLKAAAKLGRFKMNPPLRASEDREALVQGLLDGTIDMIATDHAPHSTEEKQRGLLGAPMGVVGIECAFPVMYTGMVKKGLISLEKLVSLMSLVPAKRFGIECGIEAGRRANLCVYDLDEEYVINPEEFKSKGRFTPFDGMKVNGRCLLTMCDGRIVYSR